MRRGWILPGKGIDLGETLEEAMTTLGERWATEWPKEWVQKGVEQGRREGGVDLLVRQLALRFGGDVGEQARTLLAEADDWDRLAEAGDLIIRTDTGAELLRRLAAIVRRSST